MPGFGSSGFGGTTFGSGSPPPFFLAWALAYTSRDVLVAFSGATWGHTGFASDATIVDEGFGDGVTLNRPNRGASDNWAIATQAIGSTKEIIGFVSTDVGPTGNSLGGLLLVDDVSTSPPSRIASIGLSGNGGTSPPTLVVNKYTNLNTWGGNDYLSVLSQVSLSMGGLWCD